MSTQDDAEPTPGPAYADGRYIVAQPEGGRPNGEVIMSPSGYGNDIRAEEQRANAELTAAAFTAAHKAKQMGYDPQNAVKALPELLEAAEVGLKAAKQAETLEERHEPDYHGRARESTIARVQTLENALDSAEGDDER